MDLSRTFGAHMALWEPKESFWGLVEALRAQLMLWESSRSFRSPIDALGA